MFLHFHAFLQADSGMGSLVTPVLTSLKKPMELPVVKITELSSIAAVSQATLVPSESDGGYTTVAQADGRNVGYLFWDNHVNKPVYSQSWTACRHSEKRVKCRKSMFLSRLSSREKRRWQNCQMIYLKLALDCLFIVCPSLNAFEKNCGVTGGRDEAPFAVVKPVCCKTSSLACVTLHINRNQTTASLRPTIKGRGDEHVSCSGTFKCCRKCRIHW